MAHLRQTTDEELEELFKDWYEWDRRERENDIPDELKTIEGYGDGLRDIPGFPDYECSVYGEVYSKRTQRLLSPGEDGKGYYSVVLCRDGKQYTKKIHKLVALTFLPNPENKTDVNHIDTIKKNNRLTNLEWCTHSENMKHAYANGLISFPVYGGNPKRRIRIIETGEEFDSITDCAKHLGTLNKGGTGHICDCLMGKRSTHMGYHFEDVVNE